MGNQHLRTYLAATAISILLGAPALADEPAPPAGETGDASPVGRLISKPGGLGKAIKQGRTPMTPEERQRALALRTQRDSLDETTWRTEREAQVYEQTFVALWDALRSESDKLDVLARFPSDHITLAWPARFEAISDGIEITELTQSKASLSAPEWAALVAQMRSDGFRIEQTEWHHATFEPREGAEPQSAFSIVLHGIHEPTGARYDVTGKITIDWSAKKDAAGLPLVAAIDATGLTVKRRSGPDYFESQTLGDVTSSAGTSAIILGDMTGDGLSEIAAPSVNKVWVGDGKGNFASTKLTVAATPHLRLDGLMADFTGDGRVDYLVAGSSPTRGQVDVQFTLFLFEGDGSIPFVSAPRNAIDHRAVPLHYPVGITAGDIDGDGDLDLFVPQYLQPYVGGQFPTPYYDANDGLPSYLLLNDGNGKFVDATVDAGLAAKRFRRTFRSSFVDLDDDGDLDLFVVSDFAGVDVYENDGKGHFTDVTSKTVDLATNFGMAHTFGDFDASGSLDFFVTGMASTTARRLHQMGAGRDDMSEHQAQRIVIGYGNRMYLGKGSGRYEQPAFRDTVARSGWSWGCTTMDVNLDGWPDIYVANGNKSGSTAKDYCTRFWCHDIYSGSSEFDDALFQVYVEEADSYIDGEMSWNGFEHNALFLNRGPAGFANVSYLLGTALEVDCRSIASDDFDGDGRPDLAVVGRIDTVSERQELHVFMNRAPAAGNWLGVRLSDAPGVSTLGARIRVEYEGGAQEAAIVVGDSYAAQHAPLKTFGIGPRERVKAIEVRWPDGTTERRTNPKINAYHAFAPEVGARP